MLHRTRFQLHDAPTPVCLKRDRTRMLITTLFAMALALPTTCALAASPPDVAANGANWSVYGRTSNEENHSPLEQINTGNIQRLGLLWSLDLGQQPGTFSEPLAVDGVLYFAVGQSVVNAVDAASGRELWRYDPRVADVAGDKLKAAWGVRGISYARGRIFTGTQDGRLIAIDAASGKLTWSVQTTQGPDDLRYISGAPRVFHNLVVIGHGGADYGAVRGYVTAYDADSGRQVWRFYTVPGDPAKGFENKAMEMAAKTWTGEWWKRGGGGTVWNAMTYDEKYDRLYLGTGNGAPQNQKIRSPGGGDNLFLTSIVALDAKTGEYIWHYQTSPGDTWDFNCAMDITLATLNIGGRERDVILHAPKNGFFYVIDRKDGALISAEPYAKVTWASKVDLKSGRPVEAPEARFPNGDVLMWPGPVGAHNWQPMSFDPRNRLVYIPTIHLPGYFNDRGIDHHKWQPLPGQVANTGFANTLTDAVSEVDQTPQGSLQAWDPVSQTRRWSVPLQGPINGGVLSTAGNLVVQGTADGRFIIYAADTGKELRSFPAQNGIISQPISYLAQGQQQITVLTGVAATAGMFGPMSAQFGWDYRTSPRRVLTFALDGKATLPPSPRHVHQFADDPHFTIDAERSARGRKTFAINCLPCHGVEAIAGGTAPDLRVSPIPLDAAGFTTIVRGGALMSRGMPRFGTLSNDDLENLRHYLRARARQSQQARAAQAR
ncbi:MAG: PQQ-dependent dehydrogenase, methanol/ethanol family [Steroidobacteraceae bacterium]